ncbi:hypothetical protein [Flavobacterium sp. N1994]|uniref:hypothetical protein n=1 Tax=Flavobacterium sp. N1994 TaxID=2986827 RepID=UPI0022239F57|nr:hypothetical protein [Flavobacterium sp. N1994]
MAKDLLLDADLDILIEAGDFVIGESTVQEVALILCSNQGDWKNEPLIGANLIKYIRTGAKPADIKRVVTFQMEQDAKDYDDIKDLLKINT